MSLPYKGKLIPFAKELRRNMTRHEKHLWYDFLRNYPIRFIRQKVIGKYIVDFYCHYAKVVIELDGSQHYTDQGMAYDNDRALILQKYNLTILRFSNADIDNDFKGVCALIDKTVCENIKTPL